MTFFEFCNLSLLGFEPITLLISDNSGPFWTYKPKGSGFESLQFQEFLSLILVKIKRWQDKVSCGYSG